MIDLLAPPRSEVVAVAPGAASRHSSGSSSCPDLTALEAGGVDNVGELEVWGTIQDDHTDNGESGSVLGGSILGPSLLEKSGYEGSSYDGGVSGRKVFTNRYTRNRALEVL